MFYHEQLNSYKRLKEVTKVILQNEGKWPRGYHYLADQLRRASSSSMLNLSEGNYRRSSKERARFFEISRGSIGEVVSVLDIATLLGLVSESFFQKVHDELLIISKMIYRLAQKS